MKKIIPVIIMIALLLVLSPMALATDDELDISADAAKVEQLGIPTISSVNELKKKADELWISQDYANAATAYSEYAKQANWLANLIASGCDPFYGGTKDERSSFYSSNKALFNIVSKNESTANSYKAERNRAWTYQGLCYYHLGDYNAAVPILIKALDLIEIDQTEYWDLCVKALNDIVGL